MFVPIQLEPHIQQCPGRHPQGFRRGITMLTFLKIFRLFPGLNSARNHLKERMRTRRQPGQVGGNRLQRLRMRAKTNQLRMVRVPASQTPQNLLRQQSFTPAGDQGAPIEQTGVKGPNAHA